MNATKDNFYFRHTKGDGVSERAVKMVNEGYEGLKEYYGKINGKDDFDYRHDYFPNKQIPLVTASEAIRLMEGGEVAKLKVEDSVKWNSCGHFYRGVIIAICSYTAWVNDQEGQFHSVHLDELVLDEPAPPTAEQELREILDRIGTRDDCVADILTWHTKHQPIEVEVTDTMIEEKLYEHANLPTKLLDDYIDLVRWALARAKGKDVNSAKS